MAGKSNFVNPRSAAVAAVAVLALIAVAFLISPPLTEVGKG